jgi:hypothetical protein
VRPRGHKANKQELKREASSFHLQQIIKGMMAQKVVSYEKREERKNQEKEEQMKNFFNVQKGCLKLVRSMPGQQTRR